MAIKWYFSVLCWMMRVHTLYQIWAEDYPAWKGLWFGVVQQEFWPIFPIHYKILGKTITMILITWKCVLPLQSNTNPFLYKSTHSVLDEHAQILYPPCVHNTHVRELYKLCFEGCGRSFCFSTYLKYSRLFATVRSCSKILVSELIFSPPFTLQKCNAIN